MVWQDTRLKTLADKLTTVCSTPTILWGLFVFGLLRSVVMLLAYPPAHGADSIVYFLYAERITGFDAPNLSQMVAPLYPFLIVPTFKWLGSVYWLIGLQVLMAATIAPIFYLALKRYSPILASAVGLIILGDAQLAVVFNFTATESLYVWLLALGVYTFLGTLARKPAEESRFQRWLWLAVASGVVVALLLLTRPVAKFLVVPMLLVLVIVTRQWRRPLVFLGGFAGTLLVYAVISLLVVGQVEGFLSGANMITSPIVITGNEQGEYPELPETAGVDCEVADFRCMYEDDDNSLEEVVNSTLAFIGDDPPAYVARVWESFQAFLSLSGQQYGFDPQLPSEAQCTNLDEQIASLDRDTLVQMHFYWAVPDTVGSVGQLQTRLPLIMGAMCPPLPHWPPARQIVDYVSLRYRSLGRPQPLLWYGAVLVLALVLPWARRYLPLVLTIGALLVYHALVSAVLINVQPRYVVITNPLRITLLVMLLYFVGTSGLYLVDRLLTGQRDKRPEHHHE